LRCGADGGECVAMGQKLGSVPPTPGDDRWQGFLELTTGRPPWEMLVRAARLVEDPASSPGIQALDLGCGAGRDAIYLASQGFAVVAVDAAPAAGRYLEGVPGVRFECSRFEDFDFGAEDFELINAHFSLPFVGRERFEEVFGRVRAALAPGGVLTGQFFGPHDSWNVPGTAIAFHSQPEAERLLSGLSVLEWREEDQDGSTADGSSKHWHLFHYIARLG
jgi:tellurite methyltransferase